MNPSVRKYLYTALVVFCAGFAAFIFWNGKSKPEWPALKPRQGALARAREWPLTQTRVAELYKTLETNPRDPKTQLKLAKEFMQEGRVTGDYGYYNAAALSLIDNVLRADPQHFDAICLKALVLLSQHRFAEARDLAEAARAQNPYNSFVYGLLIDASVELGDYNKAVEMADKMVQIRPDIRSYSRVSYLREIHGQSPEALEAIQMAVAAGYPGNEDTEWVRMVLAHLYEDSNQPEKAEQEYRLALQERPEYPFALAGLGRIARFRGDYATAVRYFEQARDVMSDIGFMEELTDLYRLAGQPGKAEECARITIEALKKDNASVRNRPEEGHYSDRELALMYLKINDFDNAVQSARAEYERRPDNIDACETLGWALYKKGDAAAALPLLKNALRTGSRVPERLVRAGLVFRANGKTEEGRALIDQGLALKPYLDESLRAEAEATRSL